MTELLAPPAPARVAVRRAAGSEAAPARSGRAAALEPLVTAVAAGDRAAFRQLFDRTYPVLLAVATRTLRNPALSEEVVQEVFVEIWADAARFDPARGSALTWMCHIARCRSIDRVRSQQAAHRRDQRFHNETLEKTGDEVVEQVLLRAEHQEVREALTRLTPLQQQTLTMLFFQNMSCREVGLALETPVSTIKTRLRDGLTRMRRTLVTS